MIPPRVCLFTAFICLERIIPLVFHVLYMTLVTDVLCTLHRGRVAVHTSTLVRWLKHCYDLCCVYSTCDHTFDAGTLYSLLVCVFMDGDKLKWTMKPNF